MALRQQFIGFSDAIAPVKSEELIWLKQPETYCMDVVFVQKLFCSVYYCLSVHIFFEVAEKNYLI